MLTYLVNHSSIIHSTSNYCTIYLNFPAISIVNPSSDIIAAVVPTVVVAVFLIIVIVSVGFLFMYWKVRLEFVFGALYTD